MRPSREELERLVHVQRALWRPSTWPGYVPSFHEELTSPAALWLAWRHVRRSRGCHTPGADGIDVDRFEADLDANLQRLGAALRGGTYGPRGLRPIDIPKASGGTRRLGVPTLTDRVVQHALLLFLNPVAQRSLSLTSCACRPGFGAVAALHAVRDGLLARSNKIVIRADVTDFYHHVRHDRLREGLGRRFQDSGFWRIADRQLRAWAVSPGLGLPQGAPASPALANLYLRDLDYKFDSHLRLNYVRFLDDILLIVRGGMTRAHEQLERLKSELRELGLELNDKTQLAPAEEDFDFLGMTLRRVHAGKVDVRMSDKTVRRLRERIDRAAASGSPEQLDLLGQAMQSWHAHYSPFDRRTFRTIDDYYFQQTGRRNYRNHPRNLRRRFPGWMDIGNGGWNIDHCNGDIGLPPSASAATSSLVGGVAQPPEGDALPGWHAGSTDVYKGLVGIVGELSARQLELASEDSRYTLYLLGRSLAWVQQSICDSRARRLHIRRRLQDQLCRLPVFRPSMLDAAADRDEDYLAAVGLERALSSRARMLEQEVRAMKRFVEVLSMQGRAHTGPRRSPPDVPGHSRALLDRRSYQSAAGIARQSEPKSTHVLRHGLHDRP